MNKSLLIYLPLFGMLSSSYGFGKPASQDGSGLYKAVQEGSVRKAKALLHSKAQLDEEYMDGETLLMCAAAKGRVQVSKFLLDKGASVNKTDSLGYTAFTIAVTNGHLDLASLLLLRGGKVNAGSMPAILIESSYNEPNAMHYLIRHGAELNAVGGISGDTPVIAAIKANQLGQLRILLGAGADPKRKGRDSLSPEMVARKTHNEEALALIEAAHREIK